MIKRRFADQCVHTYLMACDSAAIQARGEAFSVGADGISDKQAVMNARITWAALRNARVFCVQPSTYMKVYTVADRYLTEQVAGLDWDRPISEISNEDTQRLVDTYRDQAESLPFPRLPFDAVYLAYGEHIALSPEQASLRIRRRALEAYGITRVYLFGHVLAVVGDKPYASTLLGLEGEGLEGQQIGLVTTYDAEGWTQPISLDPWVTKALMGVVEDHKEICIESAWSFGMKLDHKAQAKKSLRTSQILLPPPKPYYTIELRDELIDHSVKSILTPRVVQWSHRWDVRGHDCVRIVRGSGAIDPKVELTLKKRGYRIYPPGAPLTGEDFEKVSRRGVNLPDRTEWFAIKSYWKEAHIKGPQNAPYIPGARVLTRAP